MKGTALNSMAREFMESLISAILDERGNYIFVSKPWTDYLNLPAEQVLGRNVLEIVPDSLGMEVLRTGQPVTAHRVMHNGVPAFTTYLPRKNKDGQVCGVFLYVVVDGISNARDMIRQMEVMANEVDYYKEELSRERGARYGLDSIIGSSPAILRMKDQIVQAAKSSSTVLIEGETGSGKELIAHSIHSLSARRSANFVRVNCSAIPGELMESEFFGYTSGAFTGALKKGKPGRFELANGGSIFLDEVNLLTPTIQPKFLRVLQEMEIDPVGSDKPKSVDVRVIAATNIPLENLVREGKFRSDLYWRLNVIRIQAPPLRERKEDIPALTENVIQRLNTQLGMVVQGVSSGVLKLFQQYDWPGNVRELQNAIESAMNMAKTPVLQVHDFERLVQRVNSDHRRAGNGEGSHFLKNTKQDYERDVLRDALESCGGNKAMAARALGISRTVLYRKLNQYGLK
ncbi:MAG: sigma 54-interacting transcriptional regulator [Oscillospiraceae bacterium]|nr:sigma 54-interacting transcriptional regulator [Oscillospiraceae bacterium]